MSVNDPEILAANIRDRFCRVIDTAAYIKGVQLSAPEAAAMKRCLDRFADILASDTENLKRWSDVMNHCQAVIERLQVDTGTGQLPL